MIWIWAAVTITVVMLLLVFVLGLVRAAAVRFDDPEQNEIDEATAERMTRPNGNVEVLAPDPHSVTAGRGQSSEGEAEHAQPVREIPTVVPDEQDPVDDQRHDRGE